MDITFNTMAAKASIKDCGRALDMPYGDVDRIAKLIPATVGITIDEADTYLVWVARHDPSQWEAASNNHVLNSLLMRLFTSVFGVSHLSVRAPALLGAALYILAAYLLCRKLTPELRVQWPVFVCLVYNPFVMDYLVAARGYSMALAFLMTSPTAAQLADYRGIVGAHTSFNILRQDILQRV